MFAGLLIFMVISMNSDQLLTLSQLFTNFLTPITTFFAIVIYFKALKTSRDQNRIIISENLKNSFYRRITNVENKCNTSYPVQISGMLVSCNFNDWLAKIHDNLVDMLTSDSYFEFLDERKGGETLVEGSFDHQSLISAIKFTSLLRSNYHIRLLDNLFVLKRQVSHSEMLDSDKSELNDYLDDNFLVAYYNILGSIKSGGGEQLLLIHEIPSGPKDYEIIEIEKSSFVKFYSDRFEN